VATDEISGRHARRIQHRIEEEGGELPNIDAILTVMDGRFWAMAGHPHAIAAALSAAAVPERVLRSVPAACLRAMYEIVTPHVSEGGGVDSYLDMVRREREWMQGSGAGPEQGAGLHSELAAYGKRIRDALPASERLVDTMQLEPILAEAVLHSFERCAQMREHAG
jgi:hypothetical protein